MKKYYLLFICFQFIQQFAFAEIRTWAGAGGNFLWHNRSVNNPAGSTDGVKVSYDATTANAWTNLNTGYRTSVQNGDWNTPGTWSGKIVLSIDAESSVNSNWPGNAGYTGLITVPAFTMQDWINGTIPKNESLMIASDPLPDSNGKQSRSRVHVTIDDQPKLTVSYATTLPGQATNPSPTDNGTAVSASPDICATVSDPAAGNLTVRFYGRKKVKANAKTTIIALPDTQFYTEEPQGLNSEGGGHNGIFKAQTQWIADHRVDSSVAFVVQLGDCVQNGDANEIEWKRADTSMKKIEYPNVPVTNGIPYGICVGNHDQQAIGNPDGTTLFYNQYFGVLRFTGRGYYGGYYGSNNDNHYELFSGGGVDFIHISIEYYPNGTTASLQPVLDWADALLKANPARKGIISTHNMLDIPGNFQGPGQKIYDDLKDNPNLILMLCGHVHGEGRRTDVFNGNTVHTILSDYQSGFTNGGNGYLRIMQFLPSQNLLSVKTYSPYSNTFLTGSSSQFTLPVNLTPSFTLLGTNTNVPSGSQTCLNWASLDPGSEYEWYVEISDVNNNTATGPVWSFTVPSGTSGTTPVVSTQPVSQTKCEGEIVSFISAATGVPTPTVQWQVSSDNGSTWSSIPSATTTTLTFTVVAAGNRNQYHAVWTNTAGAVTSDPGTVTVNERPSITAATPGCAGGPGTGTITVNATMSPGTIEYSKDNTNWQAGNIFNSLANGTYTVYARNTAFTSCVTSQGGVVVNCVAGCSTITVKATNVCLNGSATFTQSGGATGGTWTVTGGGTINSSGLFTATTAGGPFTVTYTGLSSCSGTATFYVNASTSGPSTPYGGTRRSIPGRLQAEDFDAGGENAGYHDGSPGNYGGAYRPYENADIQISSEGGYNVGWIQDDEWLKFSVHVNTTGTYSFTSRVSTLGNNNPAISFRVDCGSIIGQVTVPFTNGWQTWVTTAPLMVNLTEGDHLFEFLFIREPFNVNWFEFALQGYQPPTANAGPDQTVMTNQTATLAGSGTGAGITYKWTQTFGPPATISNDVLPNPAISGLTTAGLRTFRLTVTNNTNATVFDEVNINVIAPGTSTPYGGARWPIPGKLEAENYDVGGQGVAYNDGSPGNYGGAYRPAENVDVESSSEGGYNVGWIQAGEWIQFSVTVASTNNYTFTSRVASVNSGTSLQLQVDGINVGTPVGVTNTFGWQNWTTVTSTVPLTAGDHYFRFVFNQEGFNVNWFNFALAGYTPPTANAGPNQTVLTNQTATLTGSGTGAGPLTYLWEQIGGTPATISSPALATTNITGLTTTGVRTFRLTVKDNINTPATSTVTVTVNDLVTSTPFGGTRWPVPGILQAEAYDNGGQNVAYYDATPENSGGSYRPAESVDLQSCSEGGYNVGWIQAGEWVQFSVTVAGSGSYNFMSRVASVNSGTSLQLQVDGSNVGGPVAIPNTGGWQNWTTVTIPVTLSAGDHYFRFVFSGNGSSTFGFNVNFFQFALPAPRPAVTTDVVDTKQEVTNDLGVTVYPNPSTNDFRIVVNSTSEEPVTVRVMDVNGSVKSVLPLLPKSNNIRVGGKLSTGVYTAEVIQGNKRKVIKLIKVN